MSLHHRLSNHKEKIAKKKKKLKNLAQDSRRAGQNEIMDSKQLMPSNSGAKRTSRFICGGETWSTFSSCRGFFVAFSSCCQLRLRQERRVAYPAPVMSAGEDLRIEKAKILSMVSGA